MANCSFITSTEARNIARNDTLIWEEICAVQTQILAGIDSNVYSIIVDDATPFTATSSILSVTVDPTGGSNYDPVVATATIDANGTGGTGATLIPIVTGTTVTSFNITAAGTGYTPISVTATLAAPSDLTDAQDETNYDNVGGDGQYTAGLGYAVGDVITLSESSTVTVAGGGIIDAGQRVLIAAQTSAADYDNVPQNGTFTAGGSYAINDVITLSDGTTITVDTLSGSAVATFTVTTSSTASTASLTQRVQLSTTGAGVGFSLTPGTANETAVGAVSLFDVASAGVVPFFLGTTLIQSTIASGGVGGTVAIGTGFQLIPSANNVSPTTGGTGAILTPIETSGAITSVVVNNPGISYTDGTPVTFSGTNGTGATAVVRSTGVGGDILAVTVTTPVTGYETVNPLVVVVTPDPAATPALAFAGTVTLETSIQATFTVDVAGGVVTAVNVTNPGAGYADGTGFTFLLVSTAGGGDGAAEITYDVVNGAVTNPSVSVAGTTYVNGAGQTVAVSDAPEPVGAISGISIQEGGQGYADLLPTISVVDSTGSGATFTTAVAGGALTAVNVILGGSGYSASPTMTVIAAPTSSGSGATVTPLIGTSFVSTSPPNNTPTDFYNVVAGLTSDAVITDQIQFIVDYFTSLGYNIRVQTNSATTNTIQWQIIW